MTRKPSASTFKAPTKVAADPSASAPSESPLDAGQVIVFEYIKSNYFRVIHADGVIGGLTPELNIHFALFSDRPAIPQMHIHKINLDGSLGDLLNERTIVRPGIIREMDIDVVISRNTAMSLISWLGRQIDALDKIAEQQRSGDGNENSNG